MDSEKAKSFIYYGAENYTSIQALRQMVPYCYLILTFLCVAASLVGNILVFGIIEIAITLLYTLIVYTFHLWCPKPSFLCRFETNALSMVFLSLELQLMMCAGLYAGKYIDFRDIALIIGLQILSVAVFIFITVKKVKKGKYKDKKSGSSAVNITVVAGASFGGYSLVRMLHRNTDTGMKTIIIIGIFMALAVLCDIIAALNLLKYYYAKKYHINCDANGESVSKMLVVAHSDQSSMSKKSLKVILWVFLILVLIAVLYGIYRISR